MRSGAIRFGEFLIFLGVLLLGLQYIPWGNFTPSDLSDLVMGGGILLLIGFALALWSSSQLLDEVVHVVMLVVGALVVSLLLSQSSASALVNLVGPVRLEKTISYEEALAPDTAPRVTLQLINGNAKVETWGEESAKITIQAKARGWTNNEAQKALNEIELRPPKLTEQSIEFTQHQAQFILGRSAELHVTVSLPPGRVYEINIETANGKISLELLNASQARLKTLNGAIEVQGLNVQSATIETLNGKIAGRLSATQASASTTNGDIELQLGSVSGEYVLSTFNGRIKIDAPDDPQTGYAISAQSILGRVTVSLPNLLFSAQERRQIEATSAHFAQAATKITLRANTTRGNIEVR